METVWMKYPPTGEIREVEGAHENLHPLMVEGWHQCAEPAPSGPRRGHRMLPAETAPVEAEESGESYEASAAVIAAHASETEIQKIEGE